jgi:regulator of sigma E protease
VIAIGMMMTGKTEPAYLHQAPQIAGVFADSPAAKAGIHPGDVLLEVNGKPVHNWDDVIWQAMFVAPGAHMPVVVERDGRRLSLEVTTSAADDQTTLLGYPVQQVMVGVVREGLPAGKAGLKTGDRIVAIDGHPLLSPFQLSKEINAMEGKPVSLVIERGGKTFPLQIKPVHGDLDDGAGPRWYIGIGFQLRTVARDNRVSEAVKGGVRYNVMLTAEIVHTVFKLVEHKTSVKQLVGPVGIAKASGEAARQGPLAFLNIMAMISLNLGILNLLPIPILDGGHLLMLGVEGTLRRDLSLAVKERALQVGLVFLLLLFIVVMYNDVLRLIPGR